MTETARMYGGSLYDLAAEEGLDERILGELEGVTALLNGDAEYLHLLSIPSIPKKERCALLDEAFRGQVHLYVLNFMKLLCEKGALRELPGCVRAYRLRYNEAHGILEATAVSPRRRQRPPASTKSWKKSPVSTSTSKRRSSLPCWAASGWTSKAPSWTAPSAIVSPACAAASRRQRCKINTKLSGESEARLLSEPQGDEMQQDRLWLRGHPPESLQRIEW